MENLEEMGKFLVTGSIPRLIHEETENLKIPITSKVKLIMKNLSTQKFQD